MLKARFGSDFDQAVHRVLPFVKRIRLQPNTLTLCGVACSALAALAFGFWSLVWAGVLMAAAGFFDLIDGVVARAQGRGSQAGALFDSSMDRISDLLVFAGIATGLAARGELGTLVVALWALGGSVMTSYVRARAEAVLPSLQVGLMERGERFVILILGALSGLLGVALWLVAIGASITTVQRLVAARRELARLDGEPSGEAVARVDGEPSGEAVASPTEEVS